MPQPTVKFILGNGGLGRPLPGFDHYSSAIAYYKAASAVTAYATIGDKQYNSLVDAENDGIVNTCTEATAATATQTVTAIGANGDTVNLSFTSFDGNVINLGTYTKVTADSTATLVATGIVAAINANTYLTGFSAVIGSTGAYTVAATKKLGIYPNTLLTTNTITGTVAITNAAFSGGTSSRLAVWHYQISEFFRMAPSGVLYFSIKFDLSTNTATQFNTQMISDISSVASAWGGKARQYFILSNERTFDTSMLDAVKTARTALFNLYIPAEFLFTADNTGSVLSAQPNLSALTDEGVTFIAGQSLSGVGYEMSKTKLPVISSIGNALGTISASKVSQSMANVGLFNLSDGTECEKAGFLDGTDYNTISGTSLPDQLNDYGYVFLRKFPNYVGTYWNNNTTSVSPASDYRFINDNRVINKAVRNVYASILPLLNSSLVSNADGTLSTQAIAAFTSAAGYPLTQMAIDGDLSEDPSTTGGIIVSSTEVVATSGNIPIQIDLVPIGIARKITITIGYKLA